ncbi:MAG: hypothetical protein R3C59_17715 [Planctomycetaceae bacterium]
MMLNGINELCTRSDLLDRAICVSLPTIPEHKRTTEASLWKRFEEIRGRTLSVADAVSQACSARADVRLNHFQEWPTSQRGPWLLKQNFQVSPSSSRMMQTERAQMKRLSKEASYPATGRF